MAAYAMGAVAGGEGEDNATNTAGWKTVRGRELGK